MKKILYGICGIGNGHLYRQLPIIENLLLDGHQIMVFAYGLSFDYFKNYQHPNLKVAKVSVPYYMGNSQGLDFIRSAKNTKINAAQAIRTTTDNLEGLTSKSDTNLLAFGIAQEWLGSPDLVISDYEPNSFQYGYSYGCPVITVDQQSKYLLKSSPQPLNGTYYEDEIARLRMFFPYANHRIACSFFNINNIAKISANKTMPCDNVTLVPPVLRVNGLKNFPQKNQYLVYLTAQNGYPQSIEEIVSILSQRTENYSVFLSREKLQSFTGVMPCNVTLYPYGDSRFSELLQTCEGLISTAGHTLMSESMYLGIPVYALPLNIYEQQLNAYTVSENGFGVSSQVIEADRLDHFIKGNQKWRNNILNDNDILLRGDGLAQTLKIINGYLN